MFVPLNLPSDLKPYQDIGSEGIRVRVLKGKDQQLIAEMSTSNLKKKLLILLSDTIQGIDPLKLTSGDVNYIILWQAINSYGSKYPIPKLVCEECLISSTISVDLNDISSTDLSDDFAGLYSIGLSDKIVKMRCMTLADEMAILDYSKSGESTYLFQYAQVLVDDTNVIERTKMLEELNVKELNTIISTFDKMKHGPDMVVSYTCPKCAYEGKVELPFRPLDLLSPR